MNQSISGAFASAITQEEITDDKAKEIMKEFEGYDGCDKELVTEYDSKQFSRYKQSGMPLPQNETQVVEKNIIKDLKE